MISFTAYAEKKFGILERHGCIISRESVYDAVARVIGTETAGQSIFFTENENEHGGVVRVAYKKEPGAARIITFYPVSRNE